MLEYLRNFLENIGNTLLSLLRIALLSKPFKQIKDIKKSSSIVILTNGPSLNQSITSHWSFLDGKELLCVNFFPNTMYYEQLKPSYYVVSAPELWIDHAKPPYPQLSQELFENIAQKTSWSLYLFIPYAAKKYKTWQKKVALNSNIRIRYFNPTPVDGFKWFCQWAYSCQLGMPRPHNVLIPSLLLSIKLGFKQIFILGADHSWLKEITVDDNNQVLVNQKHFYDEDVSKPQPMNKLKGTRKLHEVLIKFVYAFKGYHDIEYFARKKGVIIYNATPVSFIDAFERISLK